MKRSVHIRFASGRAEEGQRASEAEEVGTVILCHMGGVHFGEVKLGMVPRRAGLRLYASYGRKDPKQVA